MRVKVKYSGRSSSAPTFTDTRYFTECFLDCRGYLKSITFRLVKIQYIWCYFWITEISQICGFFHTSRSFVKVTSKFYLGSPILLRQNLWRPCIWCCMLSPLGAKTLYCDMVVECLIILQCFHIFLMLILGLTLGFDDDLLACLIFLIQCTHN